MHDDFISIRHTIDVKGFIVNTDGDGGSVKSLKEGFFRVTRERCKEGKIILASDAS